VLWHDYVLFIINFSLSSLFHTPIWSINLPVEAACFLEGPRESPSGRIPGTGMLGASIPLSCKGGIVFQSLLCFSWTLQWICLGSYSRREEAEKERRTPFSSSLFARRIS